MRKLTIITSCYNAAQYLEESLSSVFEQSFQDWELIIIDDGSTDDSLKIMKKFCGPSNVRLLLNKNNEGIPISRNRALLEAEGEYIAIHDADDISLPSRFMEETELLDSSPEIDIVGSHAFKISHTGAFLGVMVYPPATTKEAFVQIVRYKLNPIIDPSCMYRKTAVLAAGGYTMDSKFRTALDFHLWCRLLCDGHKLENIQSPLIKYRINPEGVTRTHNQTMVETTDLIWGAFRQRNFSKVELKPSIFKQDCYSEFVKE